MLPWATLTTGFGTISKAGTDGDGVLTLLAAVVIGVLVLVAKGAKALIAAIVVCVLALAVCVYDIADVSSSGQVSVGIGLWLATLGGIAAGVGSVMMLRARRR
jgi:hypothetical protein